MNEITFLEQTVEKIKSSECSSCSTTQSYKFVEGKDNP